MYPQSRADMAVNPAATQGTLSMSRWRWAAGPLAMTAPILNEGRTEVRGGYMCVAAPVRTEHTTSGRPPVACRD